MRLCVSWRVLRLSSSFCHAARFLRRTSSVLLSSSGLDCQMRYCYCCYYCYKQRCLLCSLVAKGERVIRVIVAFAFEGSSASMTAFTIMCSWVEILRRASWQFEKSSNRIGKSVVLCWTSKGVGFLVCSILWSLRLIQWLGETMFQFQMSLGSQSMADLIRPRLSWEGVKERHKKRGE